MKTPIKACDDAGEQLRMNIDIHDRISRKYDERHGEIFNDIEQGRLRSALERSVAMVRSSSAPPLQALDFGCGSGNLTRHLLDLDADVRACDVSEQFLALVRERFKTPRLSTHRLNGTDLSEIAGESVDFIAAYSVLHHVPDYLAAVAELARVCRRGGVIYLDHEPTEGYWSLDADYARFKAEVTSFDWGKFLVWRNYVGKIRRIFNPKFANEGDIHVWPDDHVEWDLIQGDLLAAGFEMMLKEDYLLFRRGYYRDVYDRNKGRFTDMRVMVFRKL